MFIYINYILNYNIYIMKYLKAYEAWLVKPENTITDMSSEEFFKKYVKYYVSGFDNSYKTKEYDDENFKEVLNILEDKCKPFLDEMRDAKQYPLFRGAKYVTDSNMVGLYHKKSYKDRIPTDMNRDISRFFDNKFKEKLGVAIRSNGVFASKCPVVSSDYGTRYLFFPIGEYKYYWSPQISDLYGDCQYDTWYYDYISEDAWEDLYGEGMSGCWSINGVEYDSSIENSIKSAKLDDDNLSKTSNDKISRMMTWIPEVSYEDFEKKVEIEAKKEISRIVNFYKDGDIEQIQKQEITFICDEYYLVDVAFYSNFLKYFDLAL